MRPTVANVGGGASLSAQRGTSRYVLLVFTGELTGMLTDVILHPHRAEWLKHATGRECK